MPDNIPLVIITRKLPDSVEAQLCKLFDVRLNKDDHVFSREELVSAAKEADVLVSTVSDQLTAEILSSAENNLKLIANYGVGVDHIDLIAARNRLITVTNTPGVLTDDTADMAMVLLLATARRLSEGEQKLRNDNWKGWAPTGMLGTRLAGKKLGIIGMGRIGQAVARRAMAFGLSTHYHNRSPIDKKIENNLDATYWKSLDQMLTQMDFISLNCPHTPQTHHLISARRLKLLKKHAIIINTARGDVIDEQALISALQAGDIKGAGLDVFENEPAVDKRLFKLKNVVVAPHMGSATTEARAAMGEKVLINIKTFVDGHSPPDRVIVDCHKQLRSL